MHAANFKPNSGTAVPTPLCNGPCIPTVARQLQLPARPQGCWVLKSGREELKTTASSDARRQRAHKPAGAAHHNTAHAARTSAAEVAAANIHTQFTSSPVDTARQQQHDGVAQWQAAPPLADGLPASSNRQQAGPPSWQKRRQQQQPNKQQQRQKWQQRQRTGTVKANEQRMFADCCSYQSLLDVLQRLQHSVSQGAAVDQQQQQSQGQQEWRPSLSPFDCVNFIKRLAAISKSADSRGVSGVGSSISFVEDQALLQLLPLAYDTLDYYANPWQQTATAAGAAGITAARSQSPALRPTELLRCISNLAALKYSQPARLASLLDLRPAGRLGLSGLKMQQLSGLVAALAKAGVRPSNAWLVALMQEAERRLPSAGLPQLSQLLQGLVKMGVKPAASWIDSLQDQAVHCLIEQAVRCQVSQDQMQQGQQQQRDAVQLLGGSPTTGSSSSSSYTDRLGDSRSYAACQLHTIAQLLTAFAEARHSPKPQLSAALWGATASSLAAADVSSLVELLSALGELQLVPPASWMGQYYSSTAVHLQQQGRYKPWQLAESVKALGGLVKAGLQCGSSSEVHLYAQQQEQQQQHADVLAEPTLTAGAAPEGLPHWDCAAWVAAVVAVIHQQLTFFAARDIAALLCGLASLQLPLDAQQLQPILHEAQQKLSRLNTAGLAMLAEAAVELDKQQQQQQQLESAEQQQQPVLLTADWMGAFLQEAAVKFPVFPAEDLARLLIAMSRCSVCRPSSLWFEAAAVQLHSKLTVLEPSSVIQVLTAFAAMGHMPDQQWLSSALAAVKSRAVELGISDIEHLLEYLVAVDYKPDGSFIATIQWTIQQQQHTVGQLQQQPQAGVADQSQAGVLRGENADESGIVIGRCEKLLQQISRNHGAPAADAVDTSTNLSS